jgi:hypothetical protein
MSQELQDEAKPTKGQMDKSFPKGGRQGDDYRMLPSSLCLSNVIRLMYVSFVALGQDFRVRKASKRTHQVFSRLGADDTAGYEANCRDQGQERTSVLEEPVRPSNLTFTLLLYSC